MNSDREDGEIVDDLEEVSDGSISSDFPSGKCAYQGKMTVLSVSSSCPESPPYQRSGRRIHAKESSSRCYSSHRRRHYHGRRTTRRRSRSSSSDSEKPRLDLVLKLKEAVRIDKKHNSNDLQTRLKKMMERNDNLNLERISSDESLIDENELLKLREDALLSTLNKAQEADVGTVTITNDPMDLDSSDENKEQENANQNVVEDVELQELRMAALKTAIMKKCAKRKAKKQALQSTDTTNKENTHNNVNLSKEEPSKRLKTDEVVDLTSSTSTPQTPGAKEDDKTPIKQIKSPTEKVQTPEEDIDIMRARLLASISNKITSSTSTASSASASSKPKEVPQAPNSVLCIKKVNSTTMKNTAALGKKIANQKFQLAHVKPKKQSSSKIISKTQLVLPKVQPLIITINSLNSDSDDELDLSSDDSPPPKSLENPIEEFLKKTRAEFELKEQVNNKKQALKQELQAKQSQKAIFEDKTERNEDKTETKNNRTAEESAKEIGRKTQCSTPIENEVSCTKKRKLSEEKEEELMLNTNPLIFYKKEKENTKLQTTSLSINQNLENSNKDPMEEKMEKAIEISELNLDSEEKCIKEDNENVEEAIKQSTICEKDAALNQKHEEALINNQGIKFASCIFDEREDEKSAEEVVNNAQVLKLNVKDDGKAVIQEKSVVDEESSKAKQKLILTIECKEKCSLNANVNMNTFTSHTTEEEVSSCVESTDEKYCGGIQLINTHAEEEITDDLIAKSEKDVENADLNKKTSELSKQTSSCVNAEKDNSGAVAKTSDLNKKTSELSKQTSFCINTKKDNSGAVAKTADLNKKTCDLSNKQTSSCVNAKKDNSGIVAEIASDLNKQTASCVNTKKDNSAVVVKSSEINKQTSFCVNTKKNNSGASKTADLDLIKKTSSYINGKKDNFGDVAETYLTNLNKQTASCVNVKKDNAGIVAESANLSNKKTPSCVNAKEDHSGVVVVVETANLSNKKTPSSDLNKQIGSCVNAKKNNSGVAEIADLNKKPSSVNIKSIKTSTTTVSNTKNATNLNNKNAAANKVKIERNVINKNTAGTLTLAKNCNTTAVATAKTGKNVMVSSSAVKPLMLQPKRMSLQVLQNNSQQVCTLQTQTKNKDLDTSLDSSLNKSLVKYMPKWKAEEYRLLKLKIKNAAKKRIRRISQRALIAAERACENNASPETVIKNKVSSSTATIILNDDVSSKISKKINGDGEASTLTLLKPSETAKTTNSVFASDLKAEETVISFGTNTIPLSSASKTEIQIEKSGIEKTTVIASAAIDVEVEVEAESVVANNAGKSEEANVNKICSLNRVKRKDFLRKKLANVQNKNTLALAENIVEKVKLLPRLNNEGEEGGRLEEALIVDRDKDEDVEKINDKRLRQLAATQGKYKDVALLLQQQKNKLNLADVTVEKLQENVKQLENELEKARNRLKEAISIRENIAENITKLQSEEENRLNGLTTNPLLTSTPIKSSEKDQVEVEDEVQVQVQINSCEVEEVPDFQEYVSPLNNWTRDADLDPLATLCPFQLFGECKDAECNFYHP